MSESKRTGYCANCGAESSLHRFDTLQCPMNGVEEWREGKRQEWEETSFEDAGEKTFTELAVNNHDKLVEALKGLVDDLKEMDVHKYPYIKSNYKKATTLLKELINSH